MRLPGAARGPPPRALPGARARVLPGARARVLPGAPCSRRLPACAAEGHPRDGRARGVAPAAAPADPHLCFGRRSRSGQGGLINCSIASRCRWARRDVRGVEGARLESVCRGDPPTVGSNPTLSAIPQFRIRSRAHARLLPRLDGTSGGASGIQALRRSRGFGLESLQFWAAKFRIRSIWRRAWDSGASPLARLRARIPAVFRAPNSAFARGRAWAAILRATSRSSRRPAATWTRPRRRRTRKPLPASR